jgi:hypothetical protein
MDFEKETEIQKDLAKACDKTKRKGKWASVSEVNQYSDFKVSLLDLRKLVKDGMATEKLEKKVRQKLFKIRGSIGFGGPSDFSRDSEITRGPGEDTRFTEGERDGTTPRPSTEQDLRNTLGAGIAISILGGGGSSSTPRSGSIF